MKNPLKVGIENEVLTISIGVDTLCFALQAAGVVAELLEEIGAKVVDQAEFCKDILTELCREEEDGNTLVMELFEIAAVKAVENGSSGTDHV